MNRCIGTSPRDWARTVEGTMKHQAPESMKFRKLQRRLGCSRVTLVGTLELLWIAVQKNCPQGDIGRHTNEEIAIECDWEGDPDELVEALVETGWLDACTVNRLVVHDWEEHAPGWVKRQLARHQKSFVTASRLLTVTDDHLEATPNLTQPNQTKPKSATHSSSEPKSAPERVVMVFPTVGKSRAWELTQSRVDTLHEAYPDLDIVAECRKALAWIDANPSKKKTPNGMPRFLQGWMDRNQNRGRGSPASKPQRKSFDLEAWAKAGTDDSK